MATGRTANEIPESIVTGTTGSYEIPALYYGIVSAYVNAGGTFVVDGATVLDPASIDDSWTVLATYNVSGGTTTSDTARMRIRQNASAQYKLPQGTVISGTGSCRYVVELYKMPGT